MTNIKRKLINIYNNGVLIDTFTVTDATTAQQIATACKITLTEAQTLLNGRITEDLNNFCCSSPLPIINSINVVGNYINPGSITITVSITNPDTTEYTIIVKEGQTTLLNYTGSNLVNTISNLTFVVRQKRIFDIEVISNSCSGESRQTKTVSLGPEGFTYGLANGNAQGNIQEGTFYKNGTIGGQLFAQTGHSIQIQYLANSWQTEIKTVSISSNNGQTMTFTGNPFVGVGVSQGYGVPFYGRFRNLTTGGAWEDFGQQIPAVYP